MYMKGYCNAADDIILVIKDSVVSTIEHEKKMKKEKKPKQKATPKKKGKKKIHTHCKKEKKK